MDVAGPAQAKGDHPGPGRFVGEAVDQDKGAGVAVDHIGIERHWRGGRQVAEPDLVEAEGLVGQMRQGFDIDAVLERGNRGRHGAGANLEQIGAAGNERMVAHPNHMSGKLVDEFGRIARVGEDIAAGDVDLVGEGQSDRVAGAGAIERAVEGGDLTDSGRSTRAGEQDRVAGSDRARGDGSRKAAERGIRAVDPLHRKAEGLGAAARRLDRFEMIEQSRPTVPRHPRRIRDDVVARHGRKRDGADRRLAQSRREHRKTGGDLGKAVLVVANQIHLVDRQHELADAEQGADKGVPLGLRNDAMARVDEDHGEIAGRGAGRHIARVLLMPRRIGDDEGAPGSGKKAVGHVDRDSLLALVFEPVEQQRKIDCPAGGTEPLQLAFEGLQLVVEDQRTIVQQPADQGRFAVIDRSTGQKPQEIPVVRCGRRLAGSPHQK